MCGIFALFGGNYEYFEVLKFFNKIIHRGPDFSHLLYLDNYYFGFHRLSINDLSNNGNQPFVDDNIVLICNGEIYNYSSLIQEYNIDNYKSESDCEIILHLYKKIGIESMIKKLDGVFAFILYDRIKKVVYLGRDRVGVRPLFYKYDKEGNICISSEVKSIKEIEFSQTFELEGSQYLEYSLMTGNISIKNYYHFSTLEGSINFINEDFLISKMRFLLEQAVEKRLMSDRDIGCLLSGGVDSSIIASILSKKYKEVGKRVKTFSVGFNESTDIKYAREVAKYIDSDHHEIILNIDDALHKIPEVIKMIETYDITTIRASVGMYMLCEYISKNFQERVIFSGEGSDEILAGYLYFHYSPNDNELFQECKRRVLELSKYDVLRADRCTASHGLELRVPFLDKDFIHFCMQLGGKYRSPKNNIEKYYLRRAFSGYIPNNVLYRKKEGFSDGVSGLDKPWYLSIQEYIEKNSLISNNEFDLFNKVYNNKFLSKEALYYYKIFQFHYSHTPIPRYWMPKWSNAKDPSGRVLSIFNTD